MSRTVHTSLLISLFSGLTLTLIGECLAEQMLIWMQTPGEVLGLSALYLRIYFGGMIAMMIYNFGSSLLRSKGIPSARSIT